MTKREELLGYHYNNRRQETRDKRKILLVDYVYRCYQQCDLLINNYCIQWYFAIYKLYNG